MIPPQNIIMKKSPSRTAFLIVLLLGLLSYSGVVYSSSQKQISKTERVATAKQRNSKRIYSITVVPSFLANKCFVQLTTTQITTTILIQSGLIKVKLNEISRKTNLFERPLQHFKSAYVPQNSEEDHFNSIRG